LPADKVSPEKIQSSARMNRLLSFATITAAGFILGQASGIVREMVVSAHYGLSAEIDAYRLSWLVPTLINNIVAGSAITVAVMPTFAKSLAEGKRSEFWYVASTLTNLILLIAGALTILGMLLAQPIIALVGAQYPPTTQTLASVMLVIMMPVLFLSAALNMLMAMLNSVDRFGGPALIYLALNLGIIVTVVVLAPIIGIYAVAWGFLIGVALQVIIQLIELRLERPEYHWRIDLHHPALRQVAIAFGPVVALAIVSQINWLIDGVMAGALPEGSIGALSYANTILGAFYSVGISLSIAVFPTLSRMAATNDLENTGRTVNTSLRLLIFILAPLTFLLIAFAAPMVGVLLGRGKFDAVAVDKTSTALALYAIGLIGIAGLYVLQRAFNAMRDYMTPFIIGTAAMLAHIALNFILMPSLVHGGIALSASICNLGGVAVLTILLARRVPRIELSGLTLYLVRCGIVAVIATAIVAWGFAATNLGTVTVTARIIGVLFAAAGGLIYLGCAFALKFPESKMLVNLAWGFVRRTKREPVQ